MNKAISYRDLHSFSVLGEKKLPTNMEKKKKDIYQEIRTNILASK